MEWSPLFANSISNIESGGDYNLLGPVTKSGDRAYGKYQVMGSNIPEWTQDALGKKLTPSQFRSDPQAQDAVFQHKFGQYVDKYGPEGAARAWFAGEGGMNDLKRQDQLGTSVGAYGQKFMAGISQAPPLPPPSWVPNAPPIGAPAEPQTGLAAAPQTAPQLNAPPTDIAARIAAIMKMPSPPTLTLQAPQPPPEPQIPNNAFAQLQQFNRPQWVKLF